ncbi:MAG: hypothetical protein QM676_04835 [Novosphingobium sp.]
MASSNLDEPVRDPATSLDDVLPVDVQWKAHNYNYLYKVPTVFYTVAIVLVDDALSVKPQVPASAPGPAPRSLRRNASPSLVVWSRYVMV